MKKLKAKKKSHRRISASTIWTIAIGILIVGIVGLTIWLQSVHHP